MRIRDDGGEKVVVKLCRRAARCIEAAIEVMARLYCQETSLVDWEIELQ